MAKKLTGKVALVTGGSRGIGAATPLALAVRAAADLNELSALRQGGCICRGEAHQTVVLLNE